MEKEQELPNGWVGTTLGECFVWNSGGTPNTQEPKFYNGSIPWLNSGELVDGVVLNARNKISEEGLSCSSAKWVEIGSVLIAMYGANIGKTGLAGIRLTTNQAIAYANPKPVPPKYLFYFLQSVQKEFSKLGQGAAQPNISQTIIKAHLFPLPPIPEQHRIVAKIEELFSELDKGVESLKTAQEQLKIYRQAVLQRAFAGKLTEEWRRAKKDLPTRDALWKQIQEALSFKLKEREIRPKKIESLSEEELGELSELPSEWVWVKLGNVAWSLKDGPHYSPHYVESGIPFISGGNVRPEGVDFLNAKFISPELHKELSKRCLPEAGDILYTKGGTTGIARVNTYGSNFNVWVHVAVIKLIDGLLPFYVQHCLNSPHCYKQSQKFTHGVGNQDLGLTRMIKITLPICSQSEQHQVVAEIESRLSVCDKLEESIAQSLLQAEALRQSILKKAFEGKLVPQDPQDEPAEKLLARIRAERAQTQPTRKIAKGRKKQ